MYYELHGIGKPLVLLHGAFSTINTAFGQIIPELSKSRQVVAVELQGHGRTSDIDRPFSFESIGRIDLVSCDHPSYLYTDEVIINLRTADG